MCPAFKKLSGSCPVSSMDNSSNLNCSSSAVASGKIQSIILSCFLVFFLDIYFCFSFQFTSNKVEDSVVSCPRQIIWSLSFSSMKWSINSNCFNLIVTVSS